MSGYWWFVLDRWRWPLLVITAPNWPQGANAERFDIVPVVALIGATPGQYEGFSYLGFGGVLLVAAAAAIYWRSFFHSLHNHYALITTTMR